MTPPVYIESLSATVAPPLRWQLAREDKMSFGRQHVWVSPSGDTAYGVIHFHMPLPVGHGGALWGFTQEMRKGEGAAELLEKHWDEQVAGLRFLVRGKKYTVRTLMRVHGFQGLATYAGTLVDREVNEPELKLAELAREQTVWEQ